MRQNRLPDRQGVTLLELVVAISIAGIVLVSVFFSYGNLAGLFSRQSRTADDLRTTIIIQKRVERLLYPLAVINRCSKHEVEGFEAATGNPVLIRLSGHCLLKGADTAVSGLGTFEFDLKEPTGSRDPRHTAVLLWEGATIAGGWVGGAATVERK
jgi:prepilin-type N-terminal cleavage/methylation domain-containing protein